MQKLGQINRTTGEVPNRRLPLLFGCSYEMKTRNIFPISSLRPHEILTVRKESTRVRGTGDHNKSL
jgi:hypothetical protein